MIDTPPIWALRDATARGGSYLKRPNFQDVSDLVQNPEFDFRAEDLPIGCSVTVYYGGDNHTVYIAPPTSNFTQGRKRSRDTAMRRRFGRYLYRGTRYRSLSAVSADITGDPTMSGNRFFRLRARRRG